MIWLSFTCGMFIGAFVGIWIMCLMIICKREGER